MSVVTAGTGNYASDWAGAINFPGVTRSKKTGELFHYKPTADTDAARGDALSTAITAVESGDTVIISSGVYDLGTEILIIDSVSDVAIIGHGRPTIKSDLETLTAPIRVEQTCGEVNISGLKIYGQILEATYNGNGHRYALLHYGTGCVRDCDIIMYTTVELASYGVNSFKTIAAIEETPLVFENCNIMTFNTVSAASEKVYIGAHHSGTVGVGRHAVAYNNCRFLSQNINSFRFLSAPFNVSNCASNIGGFDNPRYLGLYEAKAIIPDDFVSLLDANFYASQWYGGSNGSFSCTATIDNSASGGVELFRVTKSPNFTYKNYIVEIMSQRRLYYKAHVFAGIETVLNGSLTSPTGPSLSAVFGADEDIFSIEHNGAARSMGFTIKFTPCNNHYGVASGGGGGYSDCWLEPSDVIEV